MPDVEVKTVFTIADQQQADRMREMKTQSESLTKSVDKAKQTMAGLGSAPLAKTPEMQTAGVGASERPARPRGGGSPEEHEEFKLDKEENLLRRKRMRHAKLEMAQEQATHRLAETALMAVIGEENKLASGMAKFGAFAQTTGPSLVRFGGTLGKVGSALGAIGGAASWVSLGLSAAGWILDKFGVDMEKVSEEAIDWGKHLLGRKTATDVANAAGYRNQAEMKVAEEYQKAAAAEAAMTRQLNQFGAALPVRPAIETAAAMEEWHAKVLAAANAMPEEAGALKDRIAKIEEASKASAASMQAHAQRETELAKKIDTDILPHLKALPLDATADQVNRLNTVIGGYVQSLVANQDILASEAGERAEAIRAKLAERSSIQNVIDQYKANERSQLTMDQEVKRQVKHLKVIPLSSTAARLVAFNDQLANMAKAMAEQSHWTPEKASEYLTKLKDAATEKQQRVFDFRGSRFDIKQQFAEQDADRIAVAFANDLGGMGERRVQSSFTPLFAV